MAPDARWRTLALVLAVIAGVTTATSFWLGRQLRDLETAEEGAAEVPQSVAARLELRAAEFSELPGWEEDTMAQALPALRASCGHWRGQGADRPVAESLDAGTVGDWAPFCNALEDLDDDDDGLRRLLQDTLAPWSVTDRGEATGFFTGYYEPGLRGSRRASERYRVPLYRRPPELVAVDLGAFRDDLAGRRIAGSIEGSRLVPFADRATIETGALEGRGLELVWVDDPIAAFFLHIQGSGRVTLEDGSTLRVGYDGQNGHPYRAIGRDLVERGELTREEVTLQSIERWLAEHPAEVRDLLDANASYVFFRALDGPGPLGSLGVALTPGRSLAVDRAHLPLGAPLWLDTRAPLPASARAEGTAIGTAERAAKGATKGAMGAEATVRRLVAAQDTGGAIRGPVRGDLFCGFGPTAAEIAGGMKHEGRLWLLLPKAVDPRSASPAETAG